MGTRVTGVGSTAWFVRESVDEVKGLIDPKPEPIGDLPADHEGVQWMSYKQTPRFVDLTKVSASGLPVSIVVAHIIALEPYDAG